MFEIKGKVAIVTGGAGGIGLATAKMLLEKGAKVLIADYNEKLLVAAKDELSKVYKNNVDCKVVDVTKEEQVKDAVDYAVKTYGSLDILVNNAGISGKVKAIAGDPESIADFKRVFDVNVNGVIYGGKYAADQMIKQGHGGAIVNTASIMGVVGTVGGTGYSGSKHAVIGITKSWAIDLAKYNIRVNALCPGVTDTAIVEANNKVPGYMDWVMMAHPLAAALKRIANAEEMAHAIVFMIENTFMTGQSVIVDGGYTIQ